MSGQESLLSDQCSPKHGEFGDVPDQVVRQLYAGLAAVGGIDRGGGSFWRGLSDHSVVGNHGIAAARIAKIRRDLHAMRR